MERQVWVVDFGSQYTQLITRKTRELGHSSEIITPSQLEKHIKNGNLPKALVLSGGPQSVLEDQRNYAPVFENTNLPILGICYGMQIMSHFFGGVVEKGVSGEYGHSDVHFVNGKTIDHCPDRIKVWMSHFDHVSKLPSDFDVWMESQNGFTAMVAHRSRPIIGLQFHPEVEHTDHGKDILDYFYSSVAGLEKDWNATEMLKEACECIKVAEDKHVLCAFSGGVDSLVAATLAHSLLKKRLHCFFVDNGLLRPQDHEHIETLRKETLLNIEIIQAKDLFLNALKGISDPEEKRKKIGNLFIEVFEDKVHEYEKDKHINFSYLLQGTLYPDVIESVSPHGQEGHSATIKSHHNVGGLPERMKLELLEPLRFLFKDEVRALGEELNLKHDWVYRHPFPGPGIGVRVLGKVDEISVIKVQYSDQILYEEMHNFHLYTAIWQAFTVLLPVKTVGVKGDARVFEEVICVRLVNSIDGMTAEWSEVPKDFLAKVSNRITNEVKGITRVVYDITSKPPGTIEWE